MTRKNKVNYTDEPIQLGEEVKSFLPRPEDLVLKKQTPPVTKKITVVLDDFTVRVFKEKAEEFGGSYQAMIRKLLLEYARSIKGSSSKNISI